MPERPPALYRIPFSLAAAGIMLLAIQAGQPVLGLGVLLATLCTSSIVAWRALARRPTPAIALRREGDRALREGSYLRAKSHYERALTLFARDFPPGSWDVLLNYYSLATVSSLLHEHVRADTYLQNFLTGATQGVPRPWRAQVAWLLRRVAQQKSIDGDHGRASELCHRALELVGPMPGADDATVRSLLDDLAWVRHQAGDYAGAEQLFREALALHEQFRDVIRDLATQSARPAIDKSPYRAPSPAAARTSGGLDRAVAFSLLGLGWTLYEQAAYSEARRCFERASSLVPEPHATDDRKTSLWAHRGGLQAELWRGRAAVEVTLGHFDVAQRCYRRAQEHLEPETHDTQPAVQAIDRGWLARSMGDYARSEKALEQAGELLRRCRAIPGIIACALHEGLAELRLRQGRLREALREVARAELLAEQCLGAEHPRVAGILGTRARIHGARGELADAEHAARRSLGIQRVTLGADHPRCAQGWLALGETHLRRGQLGAAEEAFGRALDLRERVLGRDHVELAEVLDGLSATYRAMGRDAEAEAQQGRRASLGGGDDLPVPVAQAVG